MVFIMITFILVIPSIAFAQEEENAEEEVEEPEPEELNFDTAYSEVSAFGATGELFEFQMEVTFKGEEEKYFELVKEFPPGWSMEISPGFNTFGICRCWIIKGICDNNNSRCFNRSFYFKTCFCQSN